MPLKVNEIFKSIQGESLYAGLPCVFIRLSGCNLRCSYCDTGYAHTHGTIMDVDEIISIVSNHNCPLIEITGGEPLLQEDTAILATKLLDLNHDVLIETNGSMDIQKLDSRCIKIVDMKCPSSNEAEKNLLSNLTHISDRDQLKFVIATEDDFSFARQTISHIRPGFPVDHILFSPVMETLPPRILAEWILEARLNVRLHLQLHKFIWPDIDRGV